MWMWQLGTVRGEHDNAEFMDWVIVEGFSASGIPRFSGFQKTAKTRKSNHPDAPQWDNVPLTDTIGENHLEHGLVHGEKVILCEEGPEVPERSWVMIKEAPTKICRWTWAIGTSMECSWDTQLTIHGILLDTQPTIHGTRLDTQLTIHRILLDTQLTIHGILLDTQPTIHGTRLDTQLTIHRILLDTQLTIHGILLDTQLTIHGIHLDTQLTIHGTRLDTQLTIHGILVDTQLTVTAMTGIGRKGNIRGYKCRRQKAEVQCGKLFYSRIICQIFNKQSTRMEMPHSDRDAQHMAQERGQRARNKLNFGCGRKSNGDKDTLKLCVS
ncbi:hypothetical protein WISP_07990 [Willisornis vidua]|uniref:Uncharacterized protein n=1 Tax=Willisornis vidua TaxID=1566151 RepID=A0ABQ9DSA9_9PASS|nr:hypothetical protein WISP_07990 [Willisornis vidua]